MTAEVRFVDGETLQYKQVRLLENGWAKATDSGGAEDYIPPHRIKNVTGDRVYVGNGDRIGGGDE